MSGPPRAVAACRLAVRAAIDRHELGGSRVLVACSGGADSLALARATAFVMERSAGGSAGAIVVDHGLQVDSRQVATRAAQQCAEMGLDPVQVVSVQVRAAHTGPEDAARTARLAALGEAAADYDASAMLLGHNREDQAEQVLLGLLRGSGARSLAGMPSARQWAAPPDRAAGVLLLRPFLGVPRQVIEQACAEVGVRPWQDPHNCDPRFARVRAGQALRDLESLVGRGVTAGLARSADLMRADAEALDEISEAAYRRLGSLPWPVQDLAAHPRAVRTRLERRMAVDAGVPGSALTSVHVNAVDALVVHWHGQGPVDLPGRVRAVRSRGRIWLRARERG